MESEITKRAKQFARYWQSTEPVETEDSSYLMSEAIDNELNRDGLSFENKLEVIKRAIELIEKQEPKTKQERFEDVWKSKNFFSKKGIDPVTGEEEIFWEKYSLESYCQNEGVSLQEFLDWKVHSK
ncbi:TPA: hypothetical protein ACWWDF_002431 [Enterococcus faecium]